MVISQYFLLTVFNTILLIVQEIRNMQRFSYEVIDTFSKKHSSLPLIFHTDKIEGHAQTNSFINFNWHEDIELLTVISGHGTLHCDAQDYDMEAGDVMVINSALLHSCSSSDEVVYHCMIPVHEFCKSIGIDTSSLRFKTRIKDPELYAILTDVAELLNKNSSEPSATTAARAIARLLDALAVIAERYPSQEGERRRGYSECDERIKRTIDYINANVTKPLTLDLIADEIGISKFHLSREFKRLTGLTIFDFIIILRLKLSRHLMREGLSVSESAFSAGFENLSYFSRKFREVQGLLPSEYAAKHRKKKNAGKVT